MSAPLQSVRPQPSCDDHIQHADLSDMPVLYKSRSSLENKCSCSCGCFCCNNETKKSEDTNNASSPARGRSTTPKFDRTNGNGRHSEVDQTATLGSASWPTAISSVDGQEGLAGHQIERDAPIEVGDLGTHAHDSIQHWLEQHRAPSHPYGPTNPPEASLLVESSTMAPSLASSGFLPPRMPSSADLLSFATGGFEEAGESKVQPCSFTPLWLTHERCYCRNMQLEGSVEVAAAYPATIDVFGLE